MALLFQPIEFGSLKLKNKIVIAPMCQYAADPTGQVNFWHEQQWASYALSGAGLCIIEATAVQENGRISFADLGLWHDAQIPAMQQALSKVKALSPMPFAIQLAHAGRKASTDRPWQGRGQFSPEHELGWQTVSASHIVFNSTDVAPHALSIDEIQQVIADFAAAARRAVKAGFDLIEIHAAHGYLLHQFMSPLSNQRSDEYGGSFENRIRLTLEVFKAIRAELVEDYPIGIRISATDWMDEQGGWNLDEATELSKHLAALGVAYIHVSSAGLHPEQQIDVYPSYQLPFSERIKQAVNVPVIGVGLITEPMQAEAALDYGHADAIAIGRAISFNPRWPWHAAAELGASIEIAPQYLRCAPHGFNQLFKAFE